MRTKLIICIVMTVLLLTAFMAPFASAVTVPTFTVSATSQLIVPLSTGNTFNGSISTTGTIRFWVSAPNGAQAANLGLVDSAAKFSFVAQQTGNYTLNFENDAPNSDPVQVAFSYVTNSSLSSGNNSDGAPLSYELASVVIAVLGSILIIVFVRRRNRVRTVDNAGSNQGGN